MEVTWRHVIGDALAFHASSLEARVCVPVDALVCVSDAVAMIKDGGKFFKPQDSQVRQPAGADANGSSSGNSRRSEKGLLVSAFAHLGPPKSEKERTARDRIDARKYDVEAWEMLAEEAQSRPIAQAVGLFDLLVSTFPTAGKFWKIYVEAHMKASNDDAVRLVFSRCLLTCFYLDLWKCYIKFIRKVNEQRGLEGREETRKAFEFMVGNVGMDIAAGPLWLEYIAFLKATPVSTPQEETQRMLMVRRAYQLAVLSPTHHVEQLWKEYEGFETSINRALAKNLLAEFQPKHLSARAVYRERKRLWDQIDQSLLPVPPSGSYKEEQQNASWKLLLAFERNNPQRVDATVLTKRVVFTYEQCLMYFYHYPDIWYDYAMWHAQNSSNDNAALIFKRAVSALPDSPVLYYAYAEFEEGRASHQRAKEIYETFINNDKIANSLAFIQYMRFVRRTEGIEAARKVFTEARKSPSCTYHLYVASATMVFCLDKDPKTARDIFELGLKQYINEPSYVIEYADFLCRLNDDRNVRALFERALNVLPPEQSVEVWNRFLAFEQMYGDIQSMLKVAQRRKEALTGEDGQPLAASESSLQELISRYRFLDLWPCSAHDLDRFAQQQLMFQKLEEKQSNLSGRKASNAPKNLIRPDVSQMTLYETKTAIIEPLPAATLPGVVSTPNLPSRVPSTEEIMKSLPPSVKGFLNHLPPVVEGPIPDVDLVISILLENDIPSPNVKPGTNGASAAPPSPTAAPKPARQAKRKEAEAPEQDDGIGPFQSSTNAPRDVFRMRQLQRSRAFSGNTAQAKPSPARSAGASNASSERSVSTE